MILSSEELSREFKDRVLQPTRRVKQSRRATLRSAAQRIKRVKMPALLFRVRLDPRVLQSLQ